MLVPAVYNHIPMSINACGSPLMVDVNMAMSPGCADNISQCVTTKLDGSVTSAGQSGDFKYSFLLNFYIIL